MYEALISISKWQPLALLGLRLLCFEPKIRPGPTGLGLGSTKLKKEDSQGCNGLAGIGDKSRCLNDSLSQQEAPNMKPDDQGFESRVVQTYFHI